MAASAAEWTCDDCMFVNLPLASECGLCREPRAAEAAGKSSDNEDEGSQRQLLKDDDDSTVQDSVIAVADEDETADDFSETASLVPSLVHQTSSATEVAAEDEAAVEGTSSEVASDEEEEEEEDEEDEEEEWHDAAVADNETRLVELGAKKNLSQEEDSFMDAFLDAADADNLKKAPAALNIAQPPSDDLYQTTPANSRDKRAVARFEVSSEQGRRPTMEDVYTVNDSIHDEVSRAFFGVFDGHAGSRAAEYCGQRMLDNITSTAAWKRHDHSAAVRFGIKRTEQAFLRAALSATPRWFDGTTVVTCLIAHGQLTVGWVGDSRCILGQYDAKESAWNAVELSHDHKPDEPNEEKRIRAVGGMIGRSLKEASATGTNRTLGAQCPTFCFGVHTANPVRCYPGGLSLSRSVGDVSLKYNPTKCVIGEPELIERKIDPALDRFLILACDGIWDVITNEKAVEIVSKAIEQKVDCARALVRVATQIGSTDNMTAIVVHLAE